MLENYEEQFKKANGKVTDGEYNVVITKMEIIENYNKNTTILNWNMTILDGLEKGVNIERRNTINGSQKSLKQLNKDLNKLEIYLESLSDLKYKITEMDNLKMKVKVVKDEKYQNVYIIGLLKKGRKK